MEAKSSIRPTPPVIETRRIVKTFPSGREVIQVLNGVDFKLERGKTASIRGESGSGKTTFLNIISGLEALDSGQLLWNGNRVDLRHFGELAAVRSSQMGLVFQAYYLLPELNLWENVLLPARFARKAGILGTEAGRIPAAPGRIGRKTQVFRGKAFRRRAAKSRLGSGPHEPPQTYFGR